MRTKTTRSILRFANVIFWATVALCSRLATAEGLSEKEILSALPKGSIIAAVPAKFDESGETLTNKAAVVAAQILPGKIAQVVVGYFTEPDPDKNGPRGVSFYSRCHVALLAKDGQRVRLLWDSGGWGFLFGMQQQEDEKYTDSDASLIFQVRDLNDDGKPEVMFSRASFGAEGTRFEIWQYDPTEKKMIQVCDAPGTIHFLKVPGVAWPRVEVTYFHASTVSTGSMEYDSKKRVYKQKDP